MKHCAAVVVFAALIWTARAADITGRVETISGETATIATEGTILPKAGDKVEIFFKLAGSDEQLAISDRSGIRHQTCPEWPPGRRRRSGVIRGL